MLTGLFTPEAPTDVVAVRIVVIPEGDVACGAKPEAVE